KNLVIPCCALLLLGGCVSKKKFNTATAHVEKLRSDSLAYEEQLRGLRAELYGMAGNARMTAEELEARKRELKAKDAELQDKARRMDDLDRRLKAQTDAMNALRKKVADALVNFKAEDLSVTMRDGKVYVSLSEKLLFPSGSAAVEPKGKEALVQLAQVMGNNADIDILVEGHTDNVPIKRGRFSDNWDLSTARATSIVRILQTAGLDPTRVTAAGRGEYVPLASNDTPDGKQRNRRTEIILNPRLDELYRTVEPSLAEPTPANP
ncbi:MAG: OmpA family protein, partial [Flavobacteriales bacterium]